MHDTALVLRSVSLWFGCLERQINWKLKHLLEGLVGKCLQGTFLCREDVYGDRPGSCLTKDSERSEHFCKICSSSFGTLPTHDVPHSTLNTHRHTRPLFPWKCAAWQAWEDCLPVSLREVPVILLSGWLAQSVECLPGQKGSQLLKCSKKSRGLGEPQPGLSTMDLLPCVGVDSGRTHILI